MSAPAHLRRRRTALLLTVAAGAAVACNEDFITGPRGGAVTLELRGWADTLVLGDVRAVRVRVLDEAGREILGVATQIDVGAPAVLDARHNAAGASAARVAVTSTTDSVALAGARPGSTPVVVTLVDPRFTTTELRRTATVVVAGVRVASAHDTTLTALGDTSLIVASALARQGTGLAVDYLAVPDQGVTWTRRGPGAVRLVGAGDSVRVIAESAGADTLVATHPTCLAGARCADTTVVRVAQGAAVALGSRTFRAWSLGDSVAPQIVLADARGNAVPGARLELVPLTAADSALVAVNVTVGGGPLASRSAAVATAALVPGTVVPATSVLRLVAPVPAASAALNGAPRRVASPAVPFAAPALVAKANGTARVAVRALGSDGVLLASDTIGVVVRQIARVVHVAPAYADLTPGDSVPVMVTAVDARGHLIPDAAFEPAMAGAVYRDGRIVVPPTAAGGQRATLAMAVVGVAQPRTHAEAATADPAPDSSRVRVRLPAPISAGDTATAAASDLSTTLLTADGRPRAGLWVRFRVPAGTLVGPDSALTDLAGVARAWWALPTRAGTYTATAVVLVDAPSTGTRPDTAGQIVLRRTATVQPGPPAAVVLRAAAPATASIGTALVPAPAVQVEDAFGNPVALPGLTVAVSAPGGVAQGFALTGTLTATTDANGQASFPAIVGTGTPGAYALRIDGSGGGAALGPLAPAVTAPVQFTGAASAPSTPSTPSAPSAATSALAVGATALASGQSTTVTVTLADTAGTAVANATPGDVALLASLGTLGATTCAAGTCTATYTATAGGTASITATIGAVAVQGSPASVVVSAPLTTVQAVAARVLTANASAAPFTPVTASGGVAPHTFVLSGGTLPAGLAFDAATGGVAGIPTAAFSITTFTVTATDAAGATSAQTFTLAVNPPLAATRAAPSTTLAVNAAYAPFAPVTASGGTAPVTFAYAGGALPAGVSFDPATGVLGGTATASHATATYTVTVTDAAGATAAESFDLRVDGPPGAPVAGAITPADGSLTLAFAAPAIDGGSAITNYEVSTDGGATWTPRRPAATTSPLVVTGLTNGAPYLLTLRAVNGTGVGPASAAVAGTPRTVPGAPAITGVTAGPSQLSVDFVAPATNGGAAVTNYEVSTNGGATWSARSPASTTSPLVITGLTNGTRYSVALRAVNAAGSGAASAPAAGTPLGLPDAPTALVSAPNSGSVSLAWTAPANDGGGAIIDYAVQYSSNGGGTWATFLHPPSTTTSQTVTGLTNGTSYLFRVAAVGAAGTGAPSAAVPGTPGTAAAPTGLAVTFNQQSATEQSAALAWTAPANTGAGPITDYLVEYKPSANAVWSTLGRTASTATSATLSGLAVAATYDFRVSAKTTVGTGAPSTVLTATTTGPSERLACTTPGTSNSSANSVTVLPCTGVQLGNLIVIPVTIENATMTPQAVTPAANSAGFTAIGTHVNGASQTTVFTKVATAADVSRTTPYGFAWSGNVKNVVTLVTYKGVDASAVGFHVAGGTGATAVSPAVTVSDASRYTLSYFYTMSEVSMGSTTPNVGQWTVGAGIWKNTTAGANNANAAAVLTADVDKTAAGTAGPQAATTGGMSSTTNWSATVLVLRPQ